MKMFSLLIGLALLVSSKVNAGSPSYDCEIKLLNLSMYSKMFSVGGHMRISMEDPNFIIPKFTSPNGSLSSWNIQSHPSFVVRKNAPSGFQLVLEGKFVSGEFIEMNSIEIEKAMPSGKSFGAWVHLSAGYGSKQTTDLTKMYALCSTTDQE